MELIRKISQLLTKLRDRKAAVKYGEADICAPCAISLEEFPLQAWQNFISYVDEAQNNPSCSCRNCLQRLNSLNIDSPADCLDFFTGLAKNTSEWLPVLDFARIPAQFDNDLFESITSEYGKAKNVAEQTEMIAGLFDNADPTRLELLCQLIEGDIERYQPAAPPTTQELVAREKAARAQLAKLLAGSWSDDVRWWLVRAITSTPAPARGFLKSRIAEHADNRIVYMTFPVLLKTGFALLKSLDNPTNPRAGQLQKLYSGQLTELTSIVGNNPT